MSLSCHQSHVCIMLVLPRVVSTSTALAFLTKMSEKCKSTSPSAIRVKNQREAISTEEKLDARS